MAWGIDLRHLKMLAENSLKYSGMSSDKKQDVIDTMWRPQWDLYIDAIKEEACETDLTQDSPIFNRILPRVGPAESTTNVHVFGRHFEQAICKNIICMFGSTVASFATYKTNQHITCEAPALPEAVYAKLNSPIAVPVSVSLGGAFYDTGETFTYYPGLATNN